MHTQTHQPDTATAHDPSRRYLCRHVHTNGNRCGSPALRGQHFCYYHDRTRLPNAPLAGRLGMFKMQPIDDRHAIQIALYDILCRIAAGDVDNKRASILLYGLQIASSNLAHRDKAQLPEAPVEHVTTHLRLGDLAPIQEIIDTEPAEQLTTSEERHPQPVASEGVILPLSELKGKDLSSSESTEPNSAPILSTQRHSEPQAQNLSISEATELQSPPATPNRNLRPACITLAAEHSHAISAPLSLQAVADFSSDASFNSTTMTRSSLTPTLSSVCGPKGGDHNAILSGFLCASRESITTARVSSRRTQSLQLTTYRAAGHRCVCSVSSGHAGIQYPHAVILQHQPVLSGRRAKRIQFLRPAPYLFRHAHQSIAGGSSVENQSLVSLRDRPVARLREFSRLTRGRFFVAPLPFGDAPFRLCAT